MDSHFNKSSLSFAIHNCSKLFFPYLSNQDISKLDLALTDINLRKEFFKGVSEFYLVNNIYSIEELKWIVIKNVNMIKCHLDFDLIG